VESRVAAQRITLGRLPRILAHRGNFSLLIDEIRQIRATRTSVRLVRSGGPECGPIGPRELADGVKSTSVV
jgi:hypothetical protein